MRSFREKFSDVIAMVRGDALESADRDRLSIDAATAAGRFAWTVAGAAENSWENVRFPVQQIGLGEPTVSDDPTGFRSVRVGGACALTIADLTAVLWGR